MSVYNAMGRQVAEIVNESMSAGSHQVTFDGSSLASGVYYYRIEAGSFSEMKKFVLMK